MRLLWSATLEALRRNPSLCLPVIFADAFDHTGSLIWPQFVAALTSWSMKTHSLFGGTYYGPAPFWLFPLVGLIRLVSTWAGACAYVIAAIVTANMIRKNKFANDSIQVALPDHARTIAWTGLLTVILGWIVMVAVGTPSISLLEKYSPQLMTNPYIVGIETLPAYLAVAYVVTPVLLQLIARVQKGQIGSDTVALSRKAAFLTTIICIFINIALSILKVPRPLSSGVSISSGYVFSWISAAPYIFLFVAFGLLVNGAPAEVPSAADEIVAY